MPVAAVTADIILLPILIAAIAVTFAIIAYLDLVDERKKQRRAEEGMQLYAGLFLRLTAQLMREDGYEIEVAEDGKVTLIQMGEAPGKTGAAKGSVYPWKAPQKTGQMPDDKKGEIPADPLHSDSGDTRPSDSLSGMSGSEAKKGGKTSGEGGDPCPVRTDSDR
jgi:hypothetical protein